MAIIAILAVTLLAFAIFLYDNCRIVEVKNKYCLVTGAGSGIGRAIAIEIAARGGHLVLWDVRKELLDLDLHEAIVLAAVSRGHSPPHVLRYQVDVSDAAAVRATAKQTQKDLLAKFDESIARLESAAATAAEHNGERGALESVHRLPDPPAPVVAVLVNNAGVVSGKRLLDPALSDADVRRTLDVNLLAHFWTLRAFLPGMIAHPRGSKCCVVTVSSIMGLLAGCCLAPYCASKAGLIGMHDSIRLELRADPAAAHVNTLLVCPYATATDMFKGALEGAGAGPAQRIMPKLRPHAVARAVVKGIETGRRVLMLPWPLGWALPLLRLLPTRMRDWAMRFAGAERGMVEFVGHGGKRDKGALRKSRDKKTR
jgi:all-trans-retinol dehydrogenase (NAD+)